ncbi:DNA polymerase epsilon catalytic subunit A-like isoform X4 [Prunus dulcis]|uniref:DNA polymerase epsilon catalytic subunit A-like isoform X4 n=1 Tax=Prunus dulcis TaxID=3755 RepID=UPI0014826DDF|nr:DNA polymerase epsilon catalytic subunit A-like isoform X4 [Prunus dulcis]
MSGFHSRKRDRGSSWSSKKQKVMRSAEEELESKLGFDLFSEGDKRLGWLLTFASSSWEDQDTRKVYSCVDLYFVSQDGSAFKSKYKFRPYFYAASKEKTEMDVEAYLRRRYENQIADIEIVEKEDLDLKNHLSGLRKSYLKLSFDNVQQLMNVKSDLLHVVERNHAKFDAADAYESIVIGKREQRPQDFLDCIIDLREFDVPYHVRFAIDNDIRCGQWYDVSVSSTGVMLEMRTDLLQRAEVHVCAFDIETTKLPLKFPDAEYDLVMMISYMVDGQGFLIINRECVGDDIEDLEYTPKPEFEGFFKVTNVKNEVELLRQWFAHMREVKPGIYVTYNGDYFDWPFLETRAAYHGLKMSDEVGFQCDKNQGECRAKFACHLDCFAWVKRDSYLPQGSQGLKAVTKAKLGYHPLEVNPEDMVRFAKEKPQQLINNLDRDLQYAIRVEGKMDLESVSNYEEVKSSILEKLVGLRDEPIREESPLIYHLDVAAMYPNIILTNRLQPSSIVTDEICTACDFNRPGKTCLRKLEWVWRGEIFMAKKSDYYHLKKQIESEFVDGANSKLSKSFLELPKMEQQSRLKERLKKYCQKAYRRVVDKPVTELREAGICMRENSFYVDTVRSFRDRRYEYKGLNKVWKGKLSEAKASGNSIKIQEAQDMVVLYDSLQLAHKCILNSFYGYVMRKGARWYSMEMAGVVTYTGAKIIQNARLLVEKIGKPLELDTDGIWCALPGSFPENFTFKTKDLKKKLTISYPCVMLNVDVARNNTNDQYQTLTDPTGNSYTTHSECSIEFEVDGPYKAMILPASKEEGILIKKRYAVFNDDGTLAELKGFEIKRRGELKLIKVFQAELFDKFLHGSTLEECYSAVASVANRWLDLLDNQGKDVADSELLEYISESSTMSKSLADYGEQKSCAVTTARRLANFLGDSMVKDKGLRCQYIVACEPKGTPVSERAVPVAIFETDAEIMKFYVRKWCKVSSDVGIRSIIDWSYYKQRLGSAIQKIVTIPAAMQKVSNPVPRVAHPDWLHKKVREKDDKFRQRKLVDMFRSLNRDHLLEKNSDAIGPNHVIDEEIVEDLEDFNRKSSSINRPRPIVRCYEVNNKKNSVEIAGQIDSQQQRTNNKENELQVQNTVSSEAIDRNVDYHGWLQIKKRKWKDTLDRRKKQRLNNARSVHHANNEVLGGGRNHKEPQGKGVNSYFRRNEEALTRCHWQIIQLVPSSQGDQFSAWVVVEGIMLKIPVTVPRVFYINSKAPIEKLFEKISEEKPQGKNVNKTLPHGRRAYNLYEAIIDEDRFKTLSKKLAALLGDPEVEGIYETKVPLEFNAIVQIGCVCKVDKTAKKRNVQDGWSVSELHMKTTTECTYLDESISFFYLYQSTSEGRAIFIAYFPSSRTITVVVVNPYQNKDLSASFLEKQFREACQALSIQPPPRNGIIIKVDYVGFPKDAEMILHRAINEHRHEHHGPTVAVIECPNFQLMKSSIGALDDFPCVSIPSNARDSNYQVLGWQQVAAKIGMQRCAASPQWLRERISLSRYAHVPLGNFELDWLIHAADIFFSRALRDQQQVLWISDDGNPDLGGINEEDTCFADEVYQHDFSFPGAYRKVTVELKIHHLAVNALLKSNQVNEMEGGALLGFESDVNSTSDLHVGFDEATSSAHTLRVLKQLIQRCLANAVTSGNVYADALLQHLYRWLCSPQSKLHDPTLHRILHKVMSKVLAILMIEFRKLGAKIIFANFYKVIIDTGKFDLSGAKAYCDSLLKTLQARELFEWIELEPLQFWHSLLFMDQYNYGGIPARADGSMHGEAQMDIVSSWNIAEYLPKKIQDHFVYIVSQFLYIPWDYEQKQAAVRTSLQNDSNCTPSITVAAAETFESHMIDFLKGQISSYFTDKLLGIVHDTILHMKELNKSEDGHHRSPGLPQLAGDIHKGDAALEFIKHVCGVFSLDQNVHHDVMVMRRNLLKYLRVREFAPEAEFRDPCAFFTLPNVICSYCNDCRDLDVCRDSALLTGEWRCVVPQCGQPYDREVMENALLQIVRQRERLYHLQDLLCLRCKQVKAAHLADQCVCAGSYKCREDATKFRSKMELIWKIAIHQKFQLLQECTEWILEVDHS